MNSLLKIKTSFVQKGLIIFFLSMSFQVAFSQDYKEMMAKGTFPLIEIQNSAETFFEGKDLGRGSGYKQWKRWEYNAIRLVDVNGLLKTDDYYYQEMARYNKELNQKLFDRSAACIADWTALGPFELNVTSGYNPGIGRITSIGIDPNNPDHILIGSPTGGVWRSEDGGQNWTPLTDFFVNMSVYSLAIDPNDSNIYYWGSGSGVVYKSWDSGLSWSRYTTGGYGPVNRLLINPRNTVEMWVSVQSSGLYHSLDGGENWQTLIDESTYDIEFHPTDTNIVYASGLDLWKSIDAGKSFEIMLDTVFAHVGVKMMAVTKAAPDNLYVLQAFGGMFGGLYISRDQGDTFEQKDQGDKNLFGYDYTGYDDAGQAPRDMDIAVSNTDTSEIFVAGINLWRSLDAGDTFNIVSHWYYQEFLPVPYSHADIDILLYNDGHLFIGSDGGFYKMEDPSLSSLEFDKSTIEDLSLGTNVHQFYRIGVAQTDPPMVSGGSQDNGSSVWVNGEWKNYFGADGMETFIVENSKKTIFGTYQLGGLFYSDDLGENSNDVYGLYDQQGTGYWITPFEKDPQDTNTYYVAYDTIYRTNDFGFSFEPISQNLNAHFLKIAPTGSDTMYAAAGSLLFRTFDGGASEWELISNQLSNINYIAIHPKDARFIAIAKSSGVTITRDGGETWEDWNEGLPGFQALCVEWQNNDVESLYLGMNYGIYHRDSLTKEWAPFNEGLPNVRVNELEINNETNEIFAGTYGRGLWVSPICDPIILDNPELDYSLDLVIAPNPILMGEDIIIKSSELTQVELRLFNQSGFLVHRNIDVNLSQDYRINTTHFKSGIFFLRVNDQGGVFVKKIIIQ